MEEQTEQREQQLGSAHEVQRFHRDVDETKDWIMEKDEALDSEDFGRDLRSVQALQRKHEGVERDLAALGDKVYQTFLMGTDLFLLYHVFERRVWYSVVWSLLHCNLMKIAWFKCAALKPVRFDLFIRYSLANCC